MLFISVFMMNLIISKTKRISIFVWLIDIFVSHPSMNQSIGVHKKTEWLKIILAGGLLYLSFVLYFSGVQTVPVKHSAVLGYIDRIGAIVLGAYFFKEKLTKSVWLGGALILAAGLLVALFK